MDESSKTPATKRCARAKKTLKEVVGETPPCTSLRQCSRTLDMSYNCLYDNYIKDFGAMNANIVNFCLIKFNFWG
jgi:hypothetical protein